MLRQRICLLMAGVILLAGSLLDGVAAEMAMGFRVGEATHDSAIVWTRVTRDAQRKWDGYREPKKSEAKESIPTKAICFVRGPSRATSRTSTRAVVTGHWQYMSIEPASGLREFSCGPASDKHAGGNPEQPDWQPFLRVEGGFLTVSVKKANGSPMIAFRHHDVHGAVVHEFNAKSAVGADNR